MKTTVLAPAPQVDAAITAIAQNIIADFPEEKPLFVALLRGAAPFASKLMFAIAAQAPTFHPELDYMMVKTYGGERHASQPRIVTDLAPETIITGRTIIIVDDVLDKGITAQFVSDHLVGRGASSVRLAVLAEKQTEKVYPITPDYCGFSFDDVWLAGMGMDDAGAGTEHERWNSAIIDVS